MAPPPTTIITIGAHIGRWLVLGAGVYKHAHLSANVATNADECKFTTLTMYEYC